MPKFDLFNPSSGDTQHFDNEADALAAAAKEIEGFLDEDGSWIHEVFDIRISTDGVITHRPVEVKKDPPDYIQELMADDPDYAPPFDYYCDYEMRPLAPSSEVASA